jgi:peptidylprolyl isomerase
MTKTTLRAFVFTAALAACGESPALASAQTTIRVIPPPADVAAPPADAKRTASGLASTVIAAGTGKTHPAAAELVTVHYTGWTTDGKMFDSSVSRGKAATFPLDRVIAGWTEGVQLMVAGEKRRFWIPEALAYKGQQGRPKGTLVFDVELISFTESPTHAPADVEKPPSDARRTASGLSYRVLKDGTGGRHPKPNSVVTVHYSGWTTDGKLFESTVLRDMPVEFPVGGVIPGWTEGLQLMYEGEKTRFWIPEALAYKGEAGHPKGMLVFDIELIKIN